VVQREKEMTTEQDLRKDKNKLLIQKVVRKFKIINNRIIQPYKFANELLKLREEEFLKMIDERFEKYRKSWYKTENDEVGQERLNNSIFWGSIMDELKQRLEK
jgi:hypothetical protein